MFGALSDLNGDKTPGPDDFTMTFWQFGWSFLKEEVMGFFRTFMIRASSSRTLMLLFWF